MARGRGHRRGVLIGRRARRGGMGPLGTILMTATDSPNETREGHQFESMQILAADGSGASLATGQRRRAPLATITFQPRHGRACSRHRLVVRAAESGSVDVREGKETGMTQGTICLDMREAAAHLDLLTGMPDRYGQWAGEERDPVPRAGSEEPHRCYRSRSAARTRDGVSRGCCRPPNGHAPGRCSSPAKGTGNAWHRSRSRGNDGHRLDVRPVPRRHP